MTTWVALLRGINVGGGNKVEMARLRALAEGLGHSDVRTYINSGNLIFASAETDRAALARALERAIADEFGLEIPVLVVEAGRLRAVAEALPDDWVNGQERKCDVLFLFDSHDRPGIVDELAAKPEIDDVRYVPGAVLWKVDRPNLTRSGLMKLAGSKQYRGMTLRNANTVRKLAALAG